MSEYKVKYEVWLIVNKRGRFLGNKIVKEWWWTWRAEEAEGFPTFGAAVQVMAGLGPGHHVIGPVTVEIAHH